MALGETQFETVCRLLNKVREHRKQASGDLSLTEEDLRTLRTALEYYRETVDPSTGDVITSVAFRCPYCDSAEEFRAQDRQVSVENPHADVGGEIYRIHGIAECTECKLQVLLTQFQPIEGAEFDADAWADLYETEYQDREELRPLPPQDE